MEETETSGTKKALVLSGGAAYGAFQVGALQYLMEEYVHKDNYQTWDLIAGVSVGALNGAMLRMHSIEKLKDIWDTISNRKVYTGKFTEFRLLLSFILGIAGRKSVLGNKPLQKNIQKWITDEIIKDSKNLLVGVTSLASGEYHSFDVEDFNKRPEDFRQVILASTSIPLFWPPVPIVEDNRGHRYYDLVDGGSRNVSPLGDVVDRDIDEIVVINCDPFKVKTAEKPFTNIGQIALRSIEEIMVNEIFRTDVHEHDRINDLVKQAKDCGCVLYKYKNHPTKKKKPLEYFKTIVIQPDCPGKMGSSIDFSSEWVNKRINYGIEMAKEKLPE